MRNGKIGDLKRVAVRDALRATNCNWQAAGKLLGMSGRGVALLAMREKLVKPGRNLGQKRWVLA